MADDVFPDVSDADDLILLLDKVKDGLLQWYEEDGPPDLDNDEYRRIRALLIRVPGLRGVLPDIVVKGRNIRDAVALCGEQITTSEFRKRLVEQLAPSFALLEENEMAFGSNFELGELIGQGGFGRVFNARHRLLDRNYAIKIFNPAFAEGGESHLARFFQEANMLLELNHPNIIRVHDVGRINRRPYIVMEHFKGTNLNMAQMRFGRLPPAKAILLVMALCDALQHSHDKGIIHRDLKPSNILVAAPNQFRVIDFGLGVYIESELASRLTKTGQHVAGDKFTAPELFADPKLLDTRSDIYSIGAIWYHMLTNRPPAGKNLDGPLDVVEDLSPAHKEILFRCLDPIEARFASCEEVRIAIKANESLF
jgi:serine/threonine protein kinase